MNYYDDGEEIDEIYGKKIDKLQTKRYKIDKRSYCFYPEDKACDCPSLQVCTCWKEG